jgi:sensor histidine kinase YesM
MNTTSNPPAVAEPIAPLRRMLDGLTWGGLGILVAVAVVNGLRRNINSRLLREDVGEWLVDVASATGTGLFVGLLVVLAVLVAVNRMRSGGARDYAIVVGAAIVASAVGVVLLIGFETEWNYEGDVGGDPAGLPRMFSSTWPRYLVLSSLFAMVYLYIRRKHEDEAEMRRLDGERAAFEQQTVETRLLRLQAQIEPHFLFNTLAHVRRLYQTDRATGRAMLDNLLRYLAEALPQMREAHSTVAREVALAEAYLGIEQIRMGRRLAFAAEVDPDVADASLPPLMVVTLVENAIKHGVSPKPEGGSVTIRARRERGQVVIDVIDTGAGFMRSRGPEPVSRTRERGSPDATVPPPSSGSPRCRQAACAPRCAFPNPRPAGGDRERRRGTVERAIARLPAPIAEVLIAWRSIEREHVVGAALLGIAAIAPLMIGFMTGPYPMRASEVFRVVGNAEIWSFTLMLCILVADERVDRGAGPLATYAAAVGIAAVLGVLIGLAHSHFVWDALRNPPAALQKKAAAVSWLQLTLTVYVTFEYLLIGSLATYLYVDRRAARRMAVRVHEAARRRTDQARRMLESQLQAMQARVEPKFLFGTLAQVRDLYDADAEVAERMLEELITYLRAAMPKMRDSASTVAEEVELVRAYLEIVKLRLGQRLAYTIDVPTGIGTRACHR